MSFFQSASVREADKGVDRHLKVLFGADGNHWVTLVLDGTLSTCVFLDSLGNRMPGDVKRALLASPWKDWHIRDVRERVQNDGRQPLTTRLTVDLPRTVIRISMWSVGSVPVFCIHLPFRVGGGRPVLCEQSCFRMATLHQRL